ncbi:MAG: GNAT family N-acetyltransferase [Acidimicrobiales bacterium]
MNVTLRTAIAADYDWIIRAVDSWWGRPVAAKLPRLFLDHFHTMSVIAELDALPIGFLIGFLSPSEPSTAYIHFVGVEQEHRRRAVGRMLYESFFEQARNAGRDKVEAITGPNNQKSIDFHRSLGFTVSPALDGYNGPGTALVKFHRTL